MEEIIIIPHVQIGKIRLDMKKEEVDKLFGGSHMFLHAGDHVTYEYGDYRIAYKGDEIFEIVVLNPEDDEKAFILYSKDIFREKVEDLIAYLSDYASYTYDTEDVDLSFEYYFQSLGLSFWRESWFHSKLLNDPEYLSMSIENQEYERRFWYFQSIRMDGKNFTLDL